MAAIDFPIPTSVGQQFTVGDITWEWTGTVWQGLGLVVEPIDPNPKIILLMGA